jgi:hypothetical protein
MFVNLDVITGLVAWVYEKRLTWRFPLPNWTNLLSTCMIECALTDEMAPESEKSRRYRYDGFTG